ncbi:ATP synthase delta chain [hydrothermal vent metagenome]|uniref:ATP synthase delta chain n=1 Tax=hydrothermal vent metagenome TaxID=652676 RepID=A0A3B1A406_9ZZZZ
MAEKSTIARPYAQAAFDIAKTKNDLKPWSEMLQFLSAVTSDVTMVGMIQNPQFQTQDLIDAVLKIGGDRLNTDVQNFVRVVAGNKRLIVLPEIAQAFETHRANEEGTIDAQVISAFKLNAAQKKELVTALKKRLDREINLTTKIDKSLIGGSIVRAGDMVIDGSITGQLDKLGHKLGVL